MGRIHRRVAVAVMGVGALAASVGTVPAAGAEDLTARVGGSLGNVSSFGTDAQGRVYVVEHGGGIRRFEPTSG